MKLKEWCGMASVAPTHPTTETGAVSFTRCRDWSMDLVHRLYFLDDYTFDNVVGAVVWMLPRSADRGFCEFCGFGPTCIVCRRGLESEAA